MKGYIEAITDSTGRLIHILNNESIFPDVIETAIAIYDLDGITSKHSDSVVLLLYKIVDEQSNSSIEPPAYTQTFEILEDLCLSEEAEATYTRFVKDGIISEETFDFIFR